MAGNMQDNFDENGNPIRCSFCGKEQGQVRRLVKGPTNIFICDECVAACSEILEESLASDFMDAARNGKLPGFLNDHGQSASQPAMDPETEGFELEDDRQVITHVPTPHEIYDELSAYVMGQEDAKRAMSVAVFVLFRYVLGLSDERSRRTRVSHAADYTFGVYLVHVVFLTLLRYFGLSNPPITPALAVPLLTLAIAVPSFAVSWLLHKIPVVGRYIT